MTKKQRTQKILELLKAKSMAYEVLSESNGFPNHIRVEGFGDIWPSTGTHNIGGKWYKRNFKHLVNALGGEMPTAPAGTKQRVTTLEADVKIMIERIEELESQVAHLQHSLSL